MLAALAAGVPVIATAECGLAPQAGLTIVPAGDPQALCDAVRKMLDANGPTNEIGKGGRI